MRSDFMKGLFATMTGVALVGGAILAAPAIAQDNLPDGPGKSTLVTGCGSCHGLGQVISEHRTAQEWSDTVTAMINNGAMVPENEFDTLVAYLANHYGPEGAAPAAPAAATPATAAPAAGAAMPAMGDAMPAAPATPPAAPTDGATMPPAGGTAPAPAAPVPAMPAQ